MSKKGLLREVERLESRIVRLEGEIAETRRLVLALEKRLKSWEVGLGWKSMGALEGDVASRPPWPFSAGKEDPARWQKQISGWLKAAHQRLSFVIPAYDPSFGDWEAYRREMERRGYLHNQINEALLASAHDGG